MVKFLNCGFYDGLTCRQAILNSKSDTIRADNIKVVKTWLLYSSYGWNKFPISDGINYEIGSMFLVYTMQSYYRGLPTLFALMSTNDSSKADFELYPDFNGGQLLSKQSSSYYMIGFVVNSEKFFKTYTLKSTLGFYRNSRNYSINACVFNYLVCLNQTVLVNDCIKFFEEKSKIKLV